jgi:hypothetical protein
VTPAAQSMQTASLISYRRGTIQVLDQAGLKKASCECYAIVKERFDAFLTPRPRYRAITKAGAIRPRRTELTMPLSPDGRRSVLSVNAMPALSIPVSLL